MRGFDVFMKAAKLVYRRYPNVLFVVVGEDRSYYHDDRLVTGDQYKSFREFVLAQDQYDLSKFHFTGRIPPEQLAEVLGMSDRILVMRLGRIVAELDAAGATQEDVLRAALGQAA